MASTNAPVADPTPLGSTNTGDVDMADAPAPLPAKSAKGKGKGRAVDAINPSPQTKNSRMAEKRAAIKARKQRAQATTAGNSADVDIKDAGVGAIPVVMLGPAQADPAQESAFMAAVAACEQFEGKSPHTIASLDPNDPNKTVDDDKMEPASVADMPSDKVSLGEEYWVENIPLGMYEVSQLHEPELTTSVFKRELPAKCSPWPMEYLAATELFDKDIDCPVDLSLFNLSEAEQLAYNLRRPWDARGVLFEQLGEAMGNHSGKQYSHEGARKAFGRANLVIFDATGVYFMFSALGLKHGDYDIPPDRGI